MDYKITQFYVLPDSNTLPTTGSTQNLTAGQFGFFRADFTPMTAGNAAAANTAEIYAVQGRTVAEPGLGSIKSGKIFKNNIIDFTRTIASPTAANQITEVTGFTAQCGETVSISIRLMSNYLKNAFPQGMTRTVTVSTPCCECGEDPCTVVDVEDLVDSFVYKINTDARLKDFVVAEKIGTGGSAKIRISGKALTQYTQRADPSAFPYQYDRLYFWVFPYKGPEITQDYIVYDNCDLFATATVTQRASFPSGDSAWVKQLEKRWQGVNSIYSKDLYTDTNFNNAFQTLVVDGTYYDFIYLSYYEGNEQRGFEAASRQAEAILLAVPTGQTATIITQLQNFSTLTVVAETSTGSTTTTSTSTTSSTSTSSSTTLTP